MNENDINTFAKKNLPTFKGTFMRNNLPNKCRKNESAIINLDDMTGPGTHWVAYLKKNNEVYYFDSFGNLPPPVELIKYLGSDSHIYYNFKRYQNYGSVNCGQLSLKFLYNLYNQLNKKKNQK